MALPTNNNLSLHPAITILRPPQAIRATHSSTSNSQLTATARVNSNANDSNEQNADEPIILTDLPTPHILGRKRVRPEKEPSKTDRTRSCSKPSTKLVNPHSAITKRLSEFPNNALVEEPLGSGKLFCNACKTELSLKKSCVEQHIKGVLHISKLDKPKKAEDTAATIGQWIDREREKGRSYGDMVDRSYGD
jgi:hypothetical protein